MVYFVYQQVQQVMICGCQLKTAIWVYTTGPSKKLPGSNYHGYGLKQKKPRKCGAFLLTYSNNI